MTGSNKRPLAVLRIALLKKINDFIAKMRGISINMANNAGLFPTPSPSIATFNTNIAALETAEELTKTRVRGSITERNKAYDLVLDNVHNLLNYVQNLADNAADVDDALNLIVASGFDVKNQGVHVKSDFEARNTEISGIVELIAKSVSQRSSNEWQVSTDQIIWTQLPSTLQAKTKVSGLAKSTTMYFRHRPVTKDGVGNWSQIVAIIVM